MILAQAEIVFAVVVFFLFIFILLVWVVIIRFGSIWLRAYMSGVPVSMLELIGMRFRKVDARAVVRYLIMARHAGVSVTAREMELAYIQGVDLEKVALAAIEANRQGLDVTFAQLVEAELEDRLAEKLGRREG